jgi:hypothetical protein
VLAMRATGRGGRRLPHRLQAAGGGGVVRHGGRQWQSVWHQVNAAHLRLGLAEKVKMPKRRGELS